MLTGFQMQHVAFSTPYGEIWCVDCTHELMDQEGGDAVQGFNPLIQYDVDEYDAELSRGYDPDEGHADGCCCTQGISCDSCGTTLSEAYEDPSCFQGEVT